MRSAVMSFCIVAVTFCSLALSQVPDELVVSGIDMDALNRVLQEACWLESAPIVLDSLEEYPSDTLLMHSILYPDSVRRHFYYALPDDYDPETLHPLFVWLHGGVSTDELRTMEPGDLHDRVLVPELLDHGYVVAFPCGQYGATWWDPVGEEGILRIVRWIKYNFMIDDSRVFVGGFSDGASGSYSLMMLHPSAFAGYVALSGHIGVAAIDGGRGTYLPSLSNRHGIATHTDQDGLYPTRIMAGTIALAREAGAEVIYRTFDGYEHDPAYVPLMEDEIVQWMDSTSRVRFPERIVWEASEPSGCDWLMVDSVIAWPLLSGDLDHNMVLLSERLQFGFYPDWEYQGDGILVSGVVDGDYPAARAGFQEGDVIVGFKGSGVSSLDDLGSMQEDMSPGDSFTVTVRRGDGTVELEDRFNPPEYYWLLPRYAPSVRIEASYEDNNFDIHLNRLCVLRLLLHADMVNFSREVVVTCNGCEIFRGRVETDDDFMLQNLLMEMDPERMYQAELELDLQELLPEMIYHDSSN